MFNFNEALLKSFKVISVSSVTLILSNILYFIWLHWGEKHWVIDSQDFIQTFMFSSLPTIVKYLALVSVICGVILSLSGQRSKEQHLLLFGAIISYLLALLIEPRLIA